MPTCTYYRSLSVGFVCFLMFNQRSLDMTVATTYLDSSFNFWIVHGKKTVLNRRRIFFITRDKEMKALPRLQQVTKEKIIWFGLFVINVSSFVCLRSVSQSVSQSLLLRCGHKSRTYQKISSDYFNIASFYTFLVRYFKLRTC